MEKDKVLGKVLSYLEEAGGPVETDVIISEFKNEKLERDVLMGWYRSGFIGCHLKYEEDKMVFHGYFHPKYFRNSKEL